MTATFIRRRTSIAAIQGASSAAIQLLLADVAAHLARQGVRIGGVVEMSEPAASGACGRLALRDLSTGAVIAISQNLGPGSTSCNLDGGGLAAACGAVEQALSRGVDLVILSKFGKQEAARSGLADAFGAAVASRTPILTAVSPTMAQAWGDFAGSLAQYLPADREAVEDWWRRCAAGALSTAAE